MPEQIGRRETLRRGLAAANLLALVPEWAVPAPDEGEMDVPFTDYPANYNPNNNPATTNRFPDIRKIDGHTTPNDQFFHPALQPSRSRREFLAAEVHRVGEQAGRVFAG